MNDSTTHESVTVPVDRDRKILTVLRTHQSTGFVTVPFKKRNTPYARCEVIFSSPEEARKNTSSEQSFRSYWMVNHRIRDVLFHYYFSF